MDKTIEPAHAQPADKLTPAEWAERKGIAPKAEHSWQTPVSSSPFYAAADTLYGWSHHAYNYQGEHQAFRLSEEDFDAALVAASAYPAKPPHDAAVAPHAPFKAQFAAAKKTSEAPKDKR